MLNMPSQPFLGLWCLNSKNPVSRRRNLTGSDFDHALVRRPRAVHQRGQQRDALGGREPEYAAGVAEGPPRPDGARLRQRDRVAVACGRGRAHRVLVSAQRYREVCEQWDRARRGASNSPQAPERVC